MGSIGYLMGGAMAGLGQGLQKVGEEAQKEQNQETLLAKENDYAVLRDQLHERLRDKFENERLANQQQFQRSETERGYQVSAAAAGAQHAWKSEEDTKHETAATGRASIMAAPRNIAAQAALERAQQGKGPRPWELKFANVYPRKTDGSIDYNKPPANTPLQFNPNTNALYVSDGEKLVRWNALTNAPMINPASLNRNPVDPSELQRLYSNPHAVIPSAFKGGGLTEMENFERLHHFLPAGLGARLQQGGGGTTGSAIGTDETGELAGTPAQDAADQNIVEGGSYDYGEYGDRGPQASDNEPAK